MPELPEVETIVREMHETQLLGLKIEHVDIFWNRTVADSSAETFSKKITDQSILNIERRGKFIVFTLTNDILLVHLRMTGKFFIDRNESLGDPHERLRLTLSDGRILHYLDQRKFGKWILANAQNVLNKIGVEPLSSDFTLAVFKNLLKGRKRLIKPFLLDQKFVAGLGNIYVDEALWYAKIHPARNIDSLNTDEIKALHKAIILVLKKGVANTGTTLGTFQANYYSVSGRRGRNQDALNVFRCVGKNCKRCKTIIKKIILAQRGTHFCPYCQNYNL